MALTTSSIYGSFLLKAFGLATSACLTWFTQLFGFHHMHSFSQIICWSF
jgi:hypothetical protein